MHLCMRTTVDIQDDLLVAAKKVAAEMHRPLRQLIEAGLRDQLRLREKDQQKVRPKRAIKWVSANGGLPEVDISNREAMHEWLRNQ